MKGTDSLQARSELKAFLNQLGVLIETAKVKDIVNCIYDIQLYLQLLPTTLLSSIDTTIFSVTNVRTRYSIARGDSSGAIQYFGYIDSNGEWYILRIILATGMYEYINGTTDFTTNWTNRGILTYYDFNELTW